MMKAQDSLLLLFYLGVLLRHPEARALPSSRQHRSHNRLQGASLLKIVDKRPPATGQWINFPNAKEWILYGIRYAHPARREGFGIGLPTGFNCPLLKDLPLLPP